MITPEQLAIACVAFSFAGLCVGYWMRKAFFEASKKPETDYEQAGI